MTLQRLYYNVDAWMVRKIGIGREGEWRVVCGWQRYNLGERQASDFRQTSGSA